MNNSDRRYERLPQAPEILGQFKDKRLHIVDASIVETERATEAVLDPSPTTPEAASRIAAVDTYFSHPPQGPYVDELQSQPPMDEGPTAA